LKIRVFADHDPKNGIGAVPQNYPNFWLSESGEPWDKHSVDSEHAVFLSARLRHSSAHFHLKLTCRFRLTYIFLNDLSFTITQTLHICRPVLHFYHFYWPRIWYTDDDENCVGSGSILFDIPVLLQWRVYVARLLF